MNFNFYNNKILFKRYSLFVLIFIVFVILWGAFVRFSHSGDGCGTSWPLCENSFLPQSNRSLIEWLHRASSGIYILLIFLLFYLSRKVYPKKHLLRSIVNYVLFFTFIETLIGSILVIFSLVGSNTDKIRSVVLSIHLINSLILVGFLTLSYLGALYEKVKYKKPFIYFVLFFIFLGVTGSIASLSNTLFPSHSLLEALKMDFSPSSPLLVKLRILHPLIAILFTIILSLFIYRSFEPNKIPIRWNIILFLLLSLVSIGFISLITLSPILIKMIHLLLAYLFWISLVKEGFEFKKSID